MTAGQPGATGPVIVLTYGFGGGARLHRLLSRHQELACTTGTGVLPACESAADAWRQADASRQEAAPAARAPLSAAASSSVRTLANGLVVSILARQGKRRWCEIAAAEPAAARTFLEVFPSTRFICLHRSFPDVIYATLRSSEWGLAGPQYARFTLNHPASTVAALTAWWINHTSQLLGFERDQPDSCLRLRYEDLIDDPDLADRDLTKFLGLAMDDGPTPPEPPGDPVPERLEGADEPGCGAGIPVDQIPPGLLTQVDQLNETLGYPQLG